MKYIHVLIIGLLSLVTQAIAGGYPNQGFIPNAGQWPAEVNYRLSIPGGAIFVQNQGFKYVLYDAEHVTAMHERAHERNPIEPANRMIRHQGIQMKLKNGNPATSIERSEGSETRYNYYHGNNPNTWASELQAWKQLVLKDVYPGTDWKLNWSESGLKYDFLVAAGANPELISMDFEGANSVEIRNNTLYIHTIFGDIVEQAPIAWQDRPEGRTLVTCSFIQKTDGSIGFETSNYDSNLPLVIDPQLIFASYSGSIDDNWGYTATYDNFGNAYSGGIVFGANFSTTNGVFEEEFGGGQLDIGILKYNPDGTQALYISYIGGSDMELPHSMIVNEYDELLIFGTTGSSDFPVTSGSYSTEFQGGPSTTFENGFISIDNGLDIFVMRLSADGTQLLASTFVGGTGNDGFNGNTVLVKNYADEIRGAIWVDEDNHVYVGTSTSSSDFPTQSGSIQANFGGGQQDGVVVKLNGNLSQLEWSTYLGGSAPDGIFYLIVDDSQRIIVTGGTASSNFPMSATAFQPSYGGGANDGFVSIIDSSGTELIASTYVGSSSFDISYIVGSDKSSHVYIFGQTGHTADQFNFNTGIGVTGGNQFLMKLNPDLSSVNWSSAFGNATGEPDISPTALLVDFCDKIYCTGWGGAVNGLGTTTFGLPVTPDAFQSNTDGSDFYLLVIDDQAQGIEYASFLGGVGSFDHVDGGTSRFDRKGVIYQSMCAGCGGQSDFPISGNVYSATNNSSNCNNLLAKFDFESPITVSAVASVSQPVGCAPYSVQLQNTSVNADLFSWRLDDVELATTQNLIYSFSESGTYEIVLIARSSVSCNGADTASITITVVDAIEGSLTDLSACAGNVVTLGPDDFDDPYYNFNWFPSTGLDADDVRKPTLTITQTATYFVEISVGGCIDTLEQQVNLIVGTSSELPDLTGCALTDLQLGPETQPSPGATYSWTPSSGLSNTQIFNPSVNLEEDEAYQLLVNFGVGCTDTITQQVRVTYDSMDAGNDKNLCAGLPVTIGLPDNTGNYTYAWSPSNGLSSTSTPNPTATVFFNESYVVLRIPAVGVIGCPALDTVNLVVVPEPTALFGLELFPNCQGVSGVFTDSSSDYIELFWTFSNGQTSNEIAPEQVFNYSDSLSATLIAINGECRDTLSFATYVEDITKYFKENESNAFSPNGDGINDCFHPALQLAPAPNDRAFLECTDLYVYNRWGELVHSSVNDNEDCWYGTTLNGEDLPEGVYFYRFIVDGNERAGVVHLRREAP